MENTLEKKQETSLQDYSIEWEDIENVDLDYDYSLDELETFFREDFENDIIY